MAMKLRRRAELGLGGAALLAVVSVSSVLPGMATENASPSSGNSPDGEQTGAAIYASIGCAGCHGDAGGGGRGPALNGSLGIRDAGHLLNQIINGSGGMPAFGDVLTDEQIVLLASWIRDEWGGRLPLPDITLEDVTAARGG
ncbi:MAG: c-type cytochrome [Bauldia sp.]|nr:c-type cytochrome [Bauldia sp.]